MSTLQDLVDDFLAQKRIAVAGVSRSGGEAANSVYCKLRDNGYQVFATNPNAVKVEGDSCYPNLRSIPDGVGAVVVATHPDKTLDVVQECAELNISRVWMHRSFGRGSVSDEAVAYCHEHGIQVISGACPLMYLEPDVGHRCIHWWLKITGGLPSG